MKFFGENKNKGFTLLEILMGISILAALVFAMSLFFYNVSNLGNVFIQSYETQQEIQLTFQLMIPEARSMDISNIGSYPLAEAASSSIKFYSDFDGDGFYDQIRYFLDGATLKKGFLTPTGNPLTYNSANEIITDAVHDIVASTSSIFSYYDANYTGSEAVLNFPVVIADVRVIKINLTAKQQNQNSPVSFGVTVTPKSLQSN
ncbi:hypothetical protein A2999_00910 [Candidatus Wolfebacteria bacterium RIFCSPLOWO2_01_FULL_38_11]|nr:MAG: hypothetical protein A2999_00910 [Candidatus Wolfebacteria bacterium RIFCSPLOWO2_01_FULL_38_11]